MATLGSGKCTRSAASTHLGLFQASTASCTLTATSRATSTSPSALAPAWTGMASAHAVRPAVRRRVVSAPAAVTVHRRCMSSPPVMRPAGRALPESCPADLPSQEDAAPFDTQLLYEAIPHFIMMAAVKLARQLSDACGFKISAASLEAILLRTRDTWLHTSVRGEHKIASGSFGAIYDAPDIDSKRLGDAPAIIKAASIAYADMLECDAFSSHGEFIAIILHEVGWLTSGAAPVAWDLVPEPDTGRVTLYLLAPKYTMSMHDYLHTYVHSSSGGQARSVDVPSILRAAATVAEELMQLFRLGIVHADVKWHNVLVQLHPTKKTITRVSLTDFGTLTCLGKSAAVPIRLGTFMAHRSAEDENIGLASVTADMYNVGRMVMEGLFSFWLMGDCYDAVVHALAEPDLVPSILPTISMAAVRQAAEQQAGAYAGCSWWEVKPEVLQAGGLMMGAEMSYCMTGDGGELATSRMGAIFAPGAQPPPVAQALRALLPLCSSLMTLSGPSCEQVASTLRLHARSIEAAAVTGRDVLLSISASLFPGSEDEHKRLRASHMAAHEQLQTLTQEVMQLKKGQQQKEVTGYEEEEQGQGQGGEVEELVSSEVELSPSDASAAASQQQGPWQPLHRLPPSLMESPLAGGDDDLDPQDFCHIVSGTLALLGEDEHPPLHHHHQQQQPSSQDPNCSLLQRLAGLSPADKAVLITLSGWEVFEEEFVFNPEGQLVQTVDEPLPLEVVAAIWQTLSEQGN